MTFRKILFWSHLAAGVTTGLVIFMLAVTGVLLTYEVQITRWAESDIAVQAAGVAPLSADQLAEKALEATDGQASALVYENATDQAVAATFGRGGKIFLDPATGAVLQDSPTATQAFFGAVTNLHRWLSLSGPTDTGATIVGAANVVFGFLLLSGAWLWLPRLWKWGMLKTKILFRKSYPNAKARDFAWHHVFAFWAAIPLFVIILSGIVISYPWASGLVYAAYGEQAPTHAGPPGGRGGARSGPLMIAPDGVGLQAVLDQAETHDPAWERITLTLPKGTPDADIRATVDTGTGRQPTRQETLTISQQSGQVTSVSGASDQSPAGQARMWMRFAHTGEFYGLTGQTIAGLASLATLFMVYTGLALSYRRLIQPLFRRQRRAA
ncbi:MAG: PepSY-associated TM helix domain-containing protein [Qingshengfaniella sp.]